MCMCLNACAQSLMLACIVGAALDTKVKHRLHWVYSWYTYMSVFIVGEMQNVGQDTCCEKQSACMPCQQTYMLLLSLIWSACPLWLTWNIFFSQSIASLLLFLHTLTFWPFHPFFRYLTLVSLLLPAVAKRAFTLQLFRFSVCVPECSSLSSISFLYELKKKPKKRCFSSQLLSADAFYTAL